MDNQGASDGAAGVAASAVDSPLEEGWAPPDGYDAGVLTNTAAVGAAVASIGGANPMMMGGYNPMTMGGHNPMMLGGANPMMMGGYSPMMGGYNPMIMGGGGPTATGTGMMMGGDVPTVTGTGPVGSAATPMAAFPAPATPSNLASTERKDNDPPPPYDGSDPVKTFPPWRRLVALWMRDTDIPFRRRGRKILLSLKGDPLAVTGALTDDELLYEDVGFLILRKLDEACGVHMTSMLPLNFAEVVFEGVRNKGETMLPHTSVKRTKFV